MDSIVIEGGVPLRGSVEVNGAKNAALPILAAVLLTEGENVIEGVPDLRDIRTMLSLLKELGGPRSASSGPCWRGAARRGSRCPAAATSACDPSTCT